MTDMIAKSMTSLAMAFTLAAGATALPTAADAFQRLTMEDAEKRCLIRTQRFASDNVGPNGRQRSDYEIRAAYKRCIYGYTGKHVRNVPPISRR